jgi:hypothetical protein
MTTCSICNKGVLEPFRVVDGLAFLVCPSCGSFIADHEAFIARTKDNPPNYGDAFWQKELTTANERFCGTSLLRVAEIFRLAQLPLRRFLDISAGNGGLLDALDGLLPERSSLFYGIEPFPPPEAFRSRHPNYKIGTIDDLDGAFDAGVCIEVIEHLFPDQLRKMLASLAAHSNTGALYYFNSAQPSHVVTSYPTYLDPFKSGHVVSYAIAGLRPLFASCGFTVHPLPGRDWAFLAEYGNVTEETVDSLFDRLWHPLDDNLATLSACRYGPLFKAMGLESARCYLESAQVETRTRWAQELQRQLDRSPPQTASAFWTFVRRVGRFLRRT